MSLASRRIRQCHNSRTRHRQPSIRKYGRPTDRHNGERVRWNKLIEGATSLLKLVASVVEVWRAIVG